MPRTASSLSLLVGLAIVTSVLVLPPSSSVHGLGLLELDGNATNEAGEGDDWASFFPTNSSTTVFNWSFVHEPDEGDTTYFSIGSKDIEDVSQWFATGNSAPDKDEIRDGFAAAYNTSGSMRLFFGADRYANNGDAAIGFWFLQGEIGIGPTGQFFGNHVANDTFVVSHFTNGGRVGTIYVYAWDTTAPNNLRLLATGADCRDVSTSDTACARVNSNNAASPWPFQSKGNNAPANTFLPNELFEGGIDLTALYGSNIPCFNNFLVETRSSQELTATLKDLLFGGFRNCPEVPPLATPSIEKFAQATPVWIGDTIGYRLEILQSGPDEALWMNVSDTLPAVSGAWSVDDTSNCSIAAGALTCSYTNVPAGTLLFANVTASTSPASFATDCGPHDNFARVIANEGLPTQASDQTGTVTIYVQCADVGVLKTAANATVDLGDPIDFTLTLTSYGPDAAINVTLTDTLPAISGGWSLGGPNATACSLADRNVTCDFGTVPANDTRVITVQGTTLATTDCGLASNTALVTAFRDLNTSNNASTATTYVSCSGVSVTKTAAAASVDVGGNVSFTLNVTSLGPDAATNVHLNDTLPGVAIAWELASPVAGCGIASGALTCDWSSLAAGASVEIVVTGATTTADCGPITNFAMVAADLDTDLTDNAAWDTTYVTCADVGVTKTAAAATIDVGQNATFTIVVTSYGPDAATNVRLNDTLPGVAIAWELAAPVTGCSIASGVLSCDWATLASGSSVTIVVTGLVSTADCGAITNYAAVAAALDTNASNNAAWDTTFVTCADVGVEKTAAASAIDVGDNATFTIVVTSYGPDDATNVHLNDSLPGVAIAWELAAPVTGCAIAAGALTCDWATFAAGTNVTIVVTGATTTSDCGPITNYAAVAAALDTNAANNAAWDTTYATCADVGVEKTASAAAIDVGTNATFTIVVTSYGPDAATNVHLNDTLPGAAIAWELAFPVAGCGIASGALTCDWASFPAGTNATIVVTGATTTADCGPIMNFAMVAADLDTNASNNAAWDSTYVTCADVGVEKTAGAASVPVGTNATFTIVVTSYGPDDATSVHLNDTLPGVAIAWELAAPVAGCAIASGVLTCDWATMAAGSNVTIPITGATTTTDCGPITNYAAVAAALDTDATNNAAWDTTYVTCADVGIEKTAAAGAIDVGQNATFTIVVTSYGPDAATNVHLNDTLPGVAIAWELAAPVTGCSITSGVLTCDWATFAAGTNVSIVVTGATTTADCGPITNYAAVVADLDTNAANNAAWDATYVTCADVGVEKTAGASAVDVGGNASFTIVVTSHGPDAATNVHLNDTLPGVAIAWELAAPVTGCAIAAGVLACDWATLAAGSNVTIVVTGATTTADCGFVRNYAQVAAALDTNASNDAAWDATYVTCADVGIQKVAGAASVDVGGNVSFTLTVTSHGPDAATEVHVNDSLPAGFAWALASPVTGCDVSSGALVCDWASLAAGESVAITVTAATTTANCGDVTNYAATAAALDTNATNDASWATTYVTCADVSVEKTAGAAWLFAGANATWNVTIRSLGPDAAENVTVSDVLSNGTALALGGNASAYCDATGSTVTCSIPTLAAGASLVLEITTSTSTQDCGIVTNTVTVGGRVDTNSSNNVANATIEVRCPLNATRTLGFWATHTAYTERVFDGALGGSLVIGGGSHTRTIETYGELFGAWYSSVPYKTDGLRRTPTDQARMVLLQQLVAAELNCAAFGCNATIDSAITAAHVAYASGNKAQMKTYTGILDAYNNGGDSVPLPDTYGDWNPATPELSRAIANRVFWNTP